MTHDELLALDGERIREIITDASVKWASDKSAYARVTETHDDEKRENLGLPYPRTIRFVRRLVSDLSDFTWPCQICQTPGDQQEPLFSEAHPLPARLVARHGHSDHARATVSGENEWYTPTGCLVERRPGVGLNLFEVYCRA